LASLNRGNWRFVRVLNGAEGDELEGWVHGGHLERS
jgi:hypothetical protein